MKLATFWVVRNPSPVSTLRDICWETNVETFAHYTLGSQMMGRVISEENTTLYTEEAEARVDAQSRLDRLHASYP